MTERGSERTRGIVTDALPADSYCVPLISWLVAASGIPANGVTLSQYLNSGIVLCRLANVIQPGAVPKISTLPSAYAKMENIKKFCDFLRFQLRLRDADLFVTVDLFEEKNWRQGTHAV